MTSQANGGGYAEFSKAVTSAVKHPIEGVCRDLGKFNLSVPGAGEANKALLAGVFCKHAMTATDPKKNPDAMASYFPKSGVDNTPITAPDVKQQVAATSKATLNEQYKQRGIDLKSAPKPGAGF